MLKLTPVKDIYLDANDEILDTRLQLKALSYWTSEQTQGIEESNSHPLPPSEEHYRLKRQKFSQWFYMCQFILCSSIKLNKTV